MTFQITGLAAPTTYASVPVTTAAESQIDGELDIYMFDASTGVLVHKYTTNSGDCSAYASGSVTISNLIEYQGQTMNFYIVANPGSADITTVDGTTDEADFVESMTELLTVTSGKISEEIETPLLLTGKTATTVQLTAAATASINLKRAVARFDVVNPFENFIIDEIYVSDARQQGYVFMQHVGALPSDVYSMDPVTGPATYETIATERIARSVFYTYPTTMTETSITVKAHFEADPSAFEYFTVNSTADIVANSRYKIVVSEDTLDPKDPEHPDEPTLRSITLSLVVMEWDEAEELPLEYGKGASAVLSDFTASTPANWTAASKEYEFTDNLGGTLTFTATSAYGTACNIVFNENERTNLAQDIVVDKISTQTYGFSTVDEYTVTIPKYDERGGGFYNISLEVYPVNNPTAEKQVITFWNNIAINRENFGSLYDVIVEDGSFGDFITRDVVAQITSLEVLLSSTLKGVGYCTEVTRLILLVEDMESVVIPYLPKVEYVSIECDDDLVTSVDISRVKNSIREFRFYNGSSRWAFSEPVENYPNLESIYADMPVLLQPLLICNNPKLNDLYISIESSWDLSEVNFSGNPNLESLWLRGIDCSVLNLNEYPKLKRLGLLNSRTDMLDISGCPNLRSLYVDNCSEMVVKVWDTFNNLANPETVFTEGYRITDTLYTFVK